MKPILLTVAVGVIAIAILMRTSAGSNLLNVASAT